MVWYLSILTFHHLDVNRVCSFSRMILYRLHERDHFFIVISRLLSCELVDHTSKLEYILLFSKLSIFIKQKLGREVMPVLLRSFLFENELLSEVSKLNLIVIAQEHI